MSENGTYERQNMAALLRLKTDQILCDWENAVRANIPADQTLDRSLLRKSLHQLLENLGDALEDETWSHHAAANAQIALDHARQRFRIEGHGFDQVVEEYAELRQAVICSIAGDDSSCAAGLQVIHRFIDVSIKHASGLFADLHWQRERQVLVEELSQIRGQKDKLEEERDDSRGYAKSLEQERQLRSEITAMLSHDMRTPLAAASLAAEMLAGDPGNTQKGPQRASHIIRNIERLDSTIQSFLEADRLQAGQSHPIKVSRCDMSNTVDMASRVLTETYGNRFILDLAGDMVGYWDCLAMQRVIENLGSNAIKYGSATAPILLQLKKSGEQVEISVHNEGQPIAAQALPRLFEPHFRTDEAAHSLKRGWGLGLACVKAIVEAHGGSVAVDSAAGRGTTFCVRLPFDSRMGRDR